MRPRENDHLRWLPQIFHKISPPGLRPGPRLHSPTNARETSIGSEFRDSELQSPESSESRDEWGRNNPKTHIVVPAARTEPEAERTTRADTMEEERTPAKHPRLVCTRIRPFASISREVRIRFVEATSPFPDIPAHFEASARTLAARKTPHRAGRSNPGIGHVRPVRREFPGPRIHPFGFRIRRQLDETRQRQTGAEGLVDRRHR